MSAMSTIPVSSGKVTLKIPQIANELAGIIDLWSGTPSDFDYESLGDYVDDSPEQFIKDVLNMAYKEGKKDALHKEEAP